MTCNCISYNQPQPHQTDEEVLLTPPEWAQSERATIPVDACIAPAVQALWDAGVWTRGSCCGHVDPEKRSVLVDESDRAKAESVLRDVDSTIRVGAWELVWSDATEARRADVHDEGQACDAGDEDFNPATSADDVIYVGSRKYVAADAGDVRRKALEVDAARWRSLMASERIRIMGATHDGTHMGVEFWRTHPDAHPSEEYPQEKCRERLTAYADAGAATPPQPAPTVQEASRSLLDAMPGDFPEHYTGPWANATYEIITQQTPDMETSHAFEVLRDVLRALSEDRQ